MEEEFSAGPRTTSILRGRAPVDALVAGAMPALDYPEPQSLIEGDYWRSEPADGDHNVAFVHREVDLGVFRVQVRGESTAVATYAAKARVAVAATLAAQPPAILDLEGALRRAIGEFDGSVNVESGESYRSNLVRDGIPADAVLRRAAAHVFAQLSSAVKNGDITPVAAENMRFVRRLSSIASAKRPSHSDPDRPVDVVVRLEVLELARTGAQLVGFLIDPTFQFSRGYERWVAAGDWVVGAISTGTGQLSATLRAGLAPRWMVVGDHGYNSRSATAISHGWATLDLINERSTWNSLGGYRTYEATEYFIESAGWHFGY